MYVQQQQLLPPPPPPQHPHHPLQPFLTPTDCQVSRKSSPKLQTLCPKPFASDLCPKPFAPSPKLQTLIPQPFALSLLPQIFALSPLPPRPCLVFQEDILKVIVDLPEAQASARAAGLKRVPPDSFDTGKFECIVDGGDELKVPLYTGVQMLVTVRGRRGAGTGCRGVGGAGSSVAVRRRGGWWFILVSCVQCYIVYATTA